MRLIYAYGDHDPLDDNGLFYHGPSHRGTKTVSLLSEFQVPDNLPTDIRHIEFLQRNVRMIILIQRIFLPLMCKSQQKSSAFLVC